MRFHVQFGGAYYILTMFVNLMYGLESMRDLEIRNNVCKFQEKKF